MTIRKIIEKLRKEGHEVSYRERADGGVLITNIDGLKYTGAQGNAEARSLAGEEISANRKIQLSKIRPKKKPKKARVVKHRKAIIDADIKKSLLHAQRVWRKEYNKLPAEERQWMGRITTKRVRYLIKEGYSKEEIIRILQQAEYYAKRVAYPENVSLLATRLERTAEGLKMSGISFNETLYNNVLTKLQNMCGILTEDSLKDCINVMYEFEEGVITFDQMLSKLQEILYRN